MLSDRTRADSLTGSPTHAGPLLLPHPGTHLEFFIPKLGRGRRAWHVSPQDKHIHSLSLTFLSGLRKRDRGIFGKRQGQHSG